MNWEVVQGLVRHALTTVGGIMASKGYIEAGEVEIIVGGALAIIGVIWSMVNKKHKKEAE